MLVPRTAEGFRATVSALRSQDGSIGVSLHTSLPEDRCVRLFVKNLERHMPEYVVLEELENRVQGVLQLRSGRCEQAAEARPPNPALYCVGGAGTGRGEYTLPEGTLRSAGLGGDYVAPKGPLHCKRYQRFGHTQRYCGYAPQCVACGEANLRGVFHLATAAQVLQLQRNPHSQLPVLCEVERHPGCSS